MFSFVQNWFAAKPSPIGVDFGSDRLRMAQVQRIGEEIRLVAAASADVPAHVRLTPATRFAFFADTVRDLMAQGQFKGREAVLALPAAVMHIQHVRVPKLSDAETKKTLPWELVGKLPIDPNAAILRHISAGEIFSENEAKNEVIVIAAARDLVEQFLAAAAKAKLDVVGMNVEAKATVDCFTQLYRRKTDEGMTTMYIDIGATGTRATVAHDGDILFARVIPVGGEQFNKATAAAMSISQDEARLTRFGLCHRQPVNDDAPADAADVDSHAAIEPDRANDRRKPLTDAEACEQRDANARRVEAATANQVAKLIEELGFCRRYHEATFAKHPIDRLVFIGGESRHKALCLRIARELALAAQVGDPMARLVRSASVGVESGLEPGEPQPGWAIAIGLSMGPGTTAKPNRETADAAQSVHRHQPIGDRP